MGADKNGLNRIRGKQTSYTVQIQSVNQGHYRAEQDIKNKTTTENQLTKLFAIDWTILTS